MSPPPLKPPPRIRELVSEAQIARRLEALAGEIAASSPSDLVVVAILRGSFIFAADLVRALHRAGMAPLIEFMQLASYHEAQVSSGVVSILKDVDTPVAGRSVLLVDDILESGRTLAFARDLLAARGAARVLTCVLADKPGRRAVPFEADFSGFVAPDQFLIGYGMDVAHRFRQLPYIGVLEQDA